MCTIFIHELWRIGNERASLRASEFAILHNKWKKSYKRTNHEVICLFYKYWDFIQTMIWQLTAIRQWNEFYLLTRYLKLSKHLSCFVFFFSLALSVWTGGLFLLSQIRGHSWYWQSSCSLLDVVQNLPVDFGAKMVHSLWFLPKW